MLCASPLAGIAGLLVLAAGGLGSPAPLALLDPRVAQPLNELVVREPMEVARSQYLEKRLVADFSLAHSWNNEVLFGGSWTEVGDSDAESVALKVTCIECWTKGTVTAKIWEDITKPTVRLGFTGVEAYVNLGITASAGATYAINLFSTNSPVGLGFPGFSLGLVFHLDLVFSLSASIDLTGGFYVKIADDAFLETDIFDGKIIDHFFDGISTKSIPVTVVSGSATFKADLRLRVNCGCEVDGSAMVIPIPGIGAGAVVGIYANLIEFVAVLDSTPTCALQTREWFDMNVGAYANLDVVVDFKTIGVVPTISTTLLNSPTFTQCWIPNSPHETGGAYTTTATTAGVGKPPAYSQTATAPEGNGSGTKTTVASVVIPTGGGSDGTVSKPAASAPSSINGGHANPSSVLDGDLVTSTVYSTTVYTITSCAATVVNCPASYQKEIIVTKTVDAYTTVCPAGADVTYPATKTASASAIPDLPVVAAVNIVTKVVVLSVCPTPVVETFVPPTTLAAVSDNDLTVVMPAPTTVRLAIVAAEKSIWSNSTAPSTYVAKPSAGGITSSPARPTFTAGAGRPVSGVLFGLAVAVMTAVFWL